MNLSMQPAAIAAHLVQTVGTGTTPMGDNKSREAAKLLKSQGVKVLGYGAYSVVIPHEEPNKVVKLTLGERDGYHDYVDYVQEAYVDPTFPQHLLKHLPVIYSSTIVDGVRITVLERLEYRGHMDTADSGTVEELIDMLRHAKREGLSIDCNRPGSPNVMRRADGTSVVTDPWYCSEAE